MKRFTRAQLYILSLLILLAVFALAGLFAVRQEASAEDVALKGEGTEGYPYLIENEEDYIAFAAAVNGGEAFVDKYVSQTTDLDFSSYTDVSPIGIYGAFNYFRGTYDGCGYTISNISVNSDSGGLFGALSGTVKNVNLISGTFTGQRIGCIAYSASSSQAKIINCYTSATVNAPNAGGIAFMFNAGGIYNCLTVARSSSGDYLPVSGAYSSFTYNSYTMAQSVNAASSGTTVDCEGALSADDINNSSFAYTMNRGAVLSCLNYGDAADEHGLKPWGYDGESIYLATEYKDDFSGYKLSGKGTESDPYIIATAKDFRYLAYACNTLMRTYKGKYFKQTADIDFEYIPMTAVARVDLDTSFDGIYDGGGHTMSGYRIYEGVEKNTAFFGVIGGTVANLGLEDGYVYGNCAAGIAINASSTSALVFNCYSKADMGGRRGGGIVDHFIGVVLSCVSVATMNGKPAPMAGYGVGMLSGTFSTGVEFGDTVYGTSLVNYTLTEEELFSAECAEKVNAELEAAYFAYDFEQIPAAYLWNLSDKDGKLFSGETSSKEKYDPKNYFSGRGTTYDPYIVSTAEDFKFFATSVNAGYKYSGITLRQTEDIDFDELYLLPIGVFDTEDTFCGVYDGGGHIIENLNIYQATGTCNTALFGSLSGSVYNLGYASGTVYGALSAGIAYYGATIESRVVNCYFTGNLSAYRTSGISDTFRGYIINCYSDGDDIYAGERAPLCAIAASNIIHSYSTGKINGQGLTYEDADSSCISVGQLKSYGASFASIMNAGCLYTARTGECTLQSLTEWTYEDGAVRQGGYYAKSYRSYVTDFSGSGSSYNPYRIRTAEDLLKLQIVTSAGEEYSGAYFIQTANIDCSSLEGAIPVGCLIDYAFRGEYNGGGCKITGLKLRGSVYSGAAAFIMNLGGRAINVCLYDSSVLGDYAAGIALYADVKSEAQIVNCIVCSTRIRGTKDSAGLLLYGREADIYNSLYLRSGSGSSFACKQAGRLFGVYTDGELYDDYEYITADECYIITTLPTVKNRVTYTEAIKGLNANIIELKQRYGMNIVGCVATFAADGDGGVEFNGMFSISFSNLSQSLSVFGDEISLYFLVYLGVGLVFISFFAEVAAYIKRKRLALNKADDIRRGTLSEEAKEAVYDEFYADREVALSVAEQRLIGDVKGKGGKVERDAARVNVASVAAERKAAKKRAVRKIDKEEAESAAADKKLSAEDGAKAEDNADDDGPLVFSLEDILGGDDDL